MYIILLNYLDEINSTTTIFLPANDFLFSLVKTFIKA